VLFSTPAPLAGTCGAPGLEAMYWFRTCPEHGAFTLTASSDALDVGFGGVGDHVLYTFNGGVTGDACTTATFASGMFGVDSYDASLTTMVPATSRLHAVYLDDVVEDMESPLAQYAMTITGP
jgi:hypothetical protein